MKPVRYQSIIGLMSQTLAEQIEARFKAEKIQYRLSKDTYFSEYAGKEVTSFMFEYDHTFGNIDRFEDWLGTVNEYDYYDVETRTWR